LYSTRLQNERRSALSHLRPAAAAAAATSACPSTSGSALAPLLPAPPLAARRGGSSGQRGAHRPAAHVLAHRTRRQHHLRQQGTQACLGAVILPKEARWYSMQQSEHRSADTADKQPAAGEQEGQETPAPEWSVPHQGRAFSTWPNLSIAFIQQHAVVDCQSIAQLTVSVCRQLGCPPAGHSFDPAGPTEPAGPVHQLECSPAPARSPPRPPPGAPAPPPRCWRPCAAPCC
jgi:hypothetical protein